MGHEVVYAAIDCRSIRRTRCFGFEYKEIDGIKTYALNIPLGVLPASVILHARVFLLNRLCNRIERLEGKPDIVHGHFGLGVGYASAILCNKLNLPLVITEHDSDINAQKITRKNIARLNNVYNIANKVVAVGNSLARRIKEYTSMDAIIIPNIVDTSCFNFHIKRDHSGFNFVSVGNLIYGKGMDLLIKSFHGAFKNKPHVKLFIYGDGIERNRLKKQINGFGMAERILLMGKCPRRTIAKKFQECDSFVLASRSETFGVVYIEALASGLPVIATKCGGPEDFVDNRNGVLVSVDDVNELIDAMHYMHDYAQSYEPFQISKEITDRFSPQVIAKRLTLLYEEVLEMPHRHLKDTNGRDTN